jgi:membrane fusion protein
MRSTLFRRQALEFSRERLLGEVTLARLPTLRVLTAFACAIVVCAVLFGCWGEYTRKVRVSGYLAPAGGLIRVYATQTATVTETHVSEGQHIRQGDTLVVLSTESSSAETHATQAAAIEILEGRRASLQNEIANRRSMYALRLQTTQGRIESTTTQLALLRTEIATQGERVASAQRAAERYDELLRSGFVSQAQMQQKNDDMLEQRTRLQDLERSRAALEGERQSLGREIASADLQSATERESAERDLAAAQLQLTEYRARRTIVVTAPAAGVATAILVARGQTTSPQTLLLSILPEGSQLEAHLLVPSRAIGFVMPGQSVAVRYQAFPYAHFGSHKGRIVEISRTLISPREITAPVTPAEPVYRAIVALDGPFAPSGGSTLTLRSGMLLEGDIWLERRKLLDWAWDPLRRASGIGPT